mmetsp:Transcript_60244/g.182173  ORF Transcript_60244/g.182173 Transcript_60244/m.182173 type:complete len:212 (-) Transcript_60244:716-1351(-)
MSAPMNTISVRRSPWRLFLYFSACGGHLDLGIVVASHLGPGFSSAESPAELHSTAFSLLPADHAKPFERSTPGKSKVASIFCRRSGWNGRSARYTKLEMPYSSVSGLWPLPCSSLAHPGTRLADSMSKLFVFRSIDGLTSPYWLSIMRAPGLNFVMMPLRRPNSSAETRSVLLRIRTFANSAWSTNRSTIVRLSPSSAPRSFLSTSLSGPQ